MTVFRKLPGRFNFGFISEVDALRTQNYASELKQRPY
jgi:hypothetical protein